ncbi:MAG: proton-conducting transporter membrane subunit [Kiritimatiellia bacterium]|jgi:hydrogenase-4 component F
MSVVHYFWILLLLPVAGAGMCALLRAPRAVLTVLIGLAVLEAAVGVFLVSGVFSGAPDSAAWGWFYLDALSAYHLAILLLVYLLSTVYAAGYFRHELAEGLLSPRQIRRFGILWCGALSAMALVIISNNIGAMWIGMEATTLMTAFLICVHRTAASLEAMWKYLLMCSVGVACAFMGTLLAVAAARGLPISGSDVMLWTQMRAAAAQMNLPLLKLAFLFLLVGYGAKAGLAPMHNWLPDAHSQAPAPVSALFSGFMLNTAFYCILRYVAIVEVATGGSGWSLRLLQLFGLISILVATAFILFQKDVKRLLAYCSVEHLGIISLGVGLGGFGVFAALFHVFNHAIAKTLAFFSAGRIGQIYGTHAIANIRGTLRAHPVWGIGLLGSFLALIGVAPFALFMSELQIIFAAMDGRAYVALALFLAGAGVIFMGMLKHAMAMAWGEPEHPTPTPAAGVADMILVAGSLLILLAAGLWMPAWYRDLLLRAAHIVEGKL